MTQSLYDSLCGYKEAKKLNDDGFSAKDFFEAGQQSKQDEIDALQKKIDDTLMWCEKCCILKAINILKGEETK